MKNKNVWGWNSTLYTFAPVNTVVTESLLLVQGNLNREDTEMKMNNCHIFSVLELLTLQNNSENVVWQNEPRKPRQVTMVSWLLSWKRTFLCWILKSAAGETYSLKKFSPNKWLVSVTWQMVTLLMVKRSYNWSSI